eukprot:85339-Chlamydomonas_euryale.AAC.4
MQAAAQEPVSAVPLRSRDRRPPPRQTATPRTWRLTTHGKNASAGGKLLFRVPLRNQPVPGEPVGGCFADLCTSKRSSTNTSNLGGSTSTSSLHAELSGRPPCTPDFQGFRV